MLSPVSLAAFSTGVAPTRFGQPRAVQTVRAVGGNQDQQVAPDTLDRLLPPGGNGDVSPSRTLPRGSLLDLSV